MYDSFSNGERFQKPKFDYKAYIKNALVSPIRAPSDVFVPLRAKYDESSDEEDCEGSWMDEENFH